MKSGAHQLKEGSTELDSGVKKLSEGTNDLDSGAHALQKGIQEINQALALLASQSNALVDGSAGFKAALTEIQSRLTEVSIDEDVQNEIDATLLEIMGDASETISFVSDKNTNVESVQFVLKTNEIIMDDEVEELVEEETKEVSFWDKFKALFSLRA